METFLMNPTKNSCTGALQWWPALLALSLNACSTVGPLGAESFTLEGELPADFALKAQAHYGAAGSCDGRSQTKTFKADFDSHPHEYRLRIPVNYRDGTCDLPLARVGLFINARYGDKDWQQTYDNGGLTIVDQLPEGAPAFQPDGTLSKTAQCSWLFQISKLELELSKQLSCKSAGLYLSRDQLPNKTVTLTFKLNDEDRPYLSGYWLDTDTGWKPCTGRWGTRFEELCTDPPQYRTFQMDGRQCTVYPNCTE
ncbi:MULTISPECIES: hypothetical protein [Pseudomonadaceae]|uniref:hypothetical protein n=1 Tax=Pseudomonadaceae TaxID=135621 RepID=UPI0021AD6E5F|nr:hypothetical protein [Pseudomonas sp. DNDY-54]